MRKSYLAVVLLLCFFAFGYNTSVNHNDDLSKIYIIDNYLLRTDATEGITVFDMTDPRNLQEKTRIPLDDNHDVAVKGSVMYADSRENLVVFDVSDWSNPKAKDTIYGIFNNFSMNRDWNPDDMPTTVGGSSGCNPGCGVNEAPAMTAKSSSDVANGGSESGTGGSLARFAIVGNYLYVIDYHTLKVFDITDPNRPQYKSSTEVMWDIETIFPYGDRLFIGGQTGLYIYDIKNPQRPTRLSMFRHARSCDPVVVEGNRAYVTLRSGSPCGDNGDQLDVLDISDINNPKLIETYNLENPFGLAIRDGVVFVCDGSGGLKVLDVKDPSNIRQISNIPGITAHDVIVHNDVLIVTASDGVYVYDIKSLGAPVLAGRLPQ